MSEPTPSAPPAPSPRQRWRRWVRTPRGQALSLLALLVAAIPGALAIALNRPFFARHVEEKYAPNPPVAVVKLADAIQAGTKGVEAVRGRGSDDLDGLYFVWMTAEEGYGRLPGVLVAAAPEHYAQRLERTFAAGSAAQRERAAAFALAARSPALLPTLRWARARAERLHEQRLKELLTRAIRNVVEPSRTR